MENLYDYCTEWRSQKLISEEKKKEKKKRKLRFKRESNSLFYANQLEIILQWNNRCWIKGMSNVILRRAIKWPENNKWGYRISTSMNKTHAEPLKDFLLVFVGKLLLMRLHIPSTIARSYSKVTDQSLHSSSSTNAIILFVQQRIFHAVWKREDLCEWSEKSRKNNKRESRRYVHTCRGNTRKLLVCRWFSFEQPKKLPPAKTRLYFYTEPIDFASRIFAESLWYAAIGRTAFGFARFTAGLVWQTSQSEKERT